MKGQEKSLIKTAAISLLVVGMMVAVTVISTEDLAYARWHWGHWPWGHNYKASINPNVSHAPSGLIAKPCKSLPNLDCGGNGEGTLGPYNPKGPP